MPVVLGYPGQVGSKQRQVVSRSLETLDMRRKELENCWNAALCHAGCTQS